ncbi:MAG: hypothetical protein HF973_01390 [Chloroflexi bacterium]|nr:hypothetical protein [Chloroflexota bacterium]
MKTAVIYLSYLLRLWRDDEDAPWRAALEEPLTGTIHHFASLEQLYGYLEAQGKRPPREQEAGLTVRNSERNQ